VVAALIDGCEQPIGHTTSQEARFYRQFNAGLFLWVERCKQNQQLLCSRMKL
jgi:hypothetical protein